MSTNDDQPIPFTETHQRVLDVLAGVHDALVDEVIGNYRGPDASHHAKNQVDRELHDALVRLVRTSRAKLR